MDDEVRLIVFGSMFPRLISLVIYLPCTLELLRHITHRSTPVDNI